MTAIATTLATAAPPAPGDGALSMPDGFPTASFADALAAMLDRALRDAAAPPGAGSALEPVTRFDADGFLQGGVGLPVGTPVSLPITVQVAPSEHDGPAVEETAAAVAPSLAIGSDATPSVGGGLPFAAPIAERGAEQSRATAAAIAPMADTTMRSDAVASDPATPSSAAMITPAPPRAAHAPFATTTRAPAPRPVRTPGRPSAAAPVTVGLDGDGATVSVAVSAVLDAAGDIADLRAAVARTLARHGLVLGDLKINRRASGRAFEGRG